MTATEETYLDHAASAPLLPEARAAVVRVLELGPGNPSSSHTAGRRLRRELGDAREAVAALVGCRPPELIFTSGTSESNALAIRGLLAGLAPRPPRLLVTAAAHDSVLALAGALGREGVAVTEHGVDGSGRFRPEDIVTSATGEAAVIALTLAQSVTGAVQPVSAVSAALESASAVHCDAAQAVGRLRVTLDDLGVATLAFSAHKLGGPRGIGALVVRDGAPFRSPWGDAAQERGRRAGTEAVALAAGFAAAAMRAATRPATEADAWRRVLAPLRDFVEALEDAEVITTEPALPSTLLVRFAGCPGDTLLAALDGQGIHVSTGTACASGARTAPRVLTAAGRSALTAAEGLRVSVGHGSSRADVERLVAALRGIVPRVRSALRDATSPDEKKFT